MCVCVCSYLGGHPSNGLELYFYRLARRQRHLSLHVLRQCIARASIVVVCFDYKALAECVPLVQRFSPLSQCVWDIHRRELLRATVSVQVTQYSFPVSFVRSQSQGVHFNSNSNVLARPCSRLPPPPPPSLFSLPFINNSLSLILNVTSNPPTYTTLGSLCFE